ncbi:MAG: hypothetical protein K8U03_22435 [Planctomycetia bacterium]|nr:hypothetical protein [Planctomycetia bacterium]
MNLGTNSFTTSPTTPFIVTTSQINDRIEAAVERAAQVGSFPTTIDETAGTARIGCELLAAEKLACAFERLEVCNERWKTAPLAQVKRIAEALAGRLTYLLEPIRTIETDADTCTVQMRSSPPRRADDGSRTYYELQVCGGGKLSLGRYEKQPDQSRRPVPIQLTREVFRHLTTDFIEAAG